jgi:hypothetical protein
MSVVIGGEFAIDPNLIKPDSKIIFESDEYVYSTGRSALYHILLNIRKNYPYIDTIVIPNYLCHSIIDVISYTQFKYISYEKKYR